MLSPSFLEDTCPVIQPTNMILQLEVLGRNLLMTKALFHSSPLSSSSSVDISMIPAKASTIFGTHLRSSEIEQTHLRFPDSFKNPTIRLNALMESPVLTSGIMDKSAVASDKALNQFKELRNRFLGFKKEKYLQNLEHYRSLSQSQAPKFMVIACADSRVCPTSILGFEPGEAFVVRNVANLVPPHENGPSETNAALEFAVTSLEVENILVVGHSCCGGIKALMSYQDEINSNSSSFIKNWVIVGKAAKLKTKAAASNLDFDQQCRHCEKESINRSLMNLLSYPWIEERVKNGMLSIHGGYYDFIDCTFEKWTLDYKGSSSKADEGYSIGNREFWS